MSYRGGGGASASSTVGEEKGGCAEGLRGGKAAFLIICGENSRSDSSTREGASISKIEGLLSPLPPLWCEKKNLFTTNWKGKGGSGERHPPLGFSLRGRKV